MLFTIAWKTKHIQYLDNIKLTTSGIDHFICYDTA